MAKNMWIEALDLLQPHVWWASVKHHLSGPMIILFS